MSEKALTKRILEYLRAEGFWAEKIHGGPYQRSGLPDILAFHAYPRPWSLVIEVKSPKGKLTGLQSRTLSMLASNGVQTCVARSLQDVKEFLRDIYE